MTARSPRARTPRSSPAIAVDLPAPVVPMSLKWRVSSQASRRTPASVRAAVIVRRRRAIARRARLPVRTRAPRLWTSADPRRSARAPARSSAAASGTESLHWLAIQSIVQSGSITLDHQVVRGFAVGRRAAVDVYTQPSRGSAVPQLDPSALLSQLRDVAAQLRSSGAQRRYLGVRGQQPPADPEGHRRRERRDADAPGDRKSTRLNSSHVEISYAVFCLKKKTSKRKAIAAKKGVNSDSRARSRQPMTAASAVANGTGQRKRMLGMANNRSAMRSSATSVH